MNTKKDLQELLEIGYIELISINVVRNTKIVINTYKVLKDFKYKSTFFKSGDVFQREF